MKMELLAALLHKPTVLFLDEPTIGLDIIAQKKIRDFLKYYNEQGKQMRSALNIFLWKKELPNCIKVERMKKIMRKYFQVFSLGFKKTMRYPANFFLGLISIIAVFFMHFFMWRSLYASSNGDPIFGYEYSEMILYMVLSGIIASVISSGFAWEIHSDIKEGGLARYIARPVNYAAYQFSSYIGERTGYITFSIVLIVIVYVIGNLSVLSAEHFIRFLIFLFVLTNAFILNFFIYYAVSGIGFWMRESTGIIHITGMLETIISGGVFPLDIFSKPIQMLLNGLPFSYTNYFSISVLLGKIKGIELLHGILLQWLWIGICALLARIIWSRGMKKYAAVGN